MTMGFFKRLLSIGSSKKSKKTKKAHNSALVDAEGRIVPPCEQDADDNANRLLRSSSSRYAVVAEVDYASLPPLPHPINQVTSTPPLTPGRSTSSTQPRGTYVVKVHGRTLHSRTEFPNANSPLPNRDEPRTPEHDRHDSDDEQTRPRLKEVPFTPRDQGRMHTLRQDPSVASLLDMYDDHGRLDSNAFSNTPRTPAPINEGKMQKKRTGSTLRQLLGDPESDDVRRNSFTEGDISWAERFLGEHLGNNSPFSSTSSLALPTPKDALYHNEPSEPHVITNNTYSTIGHDSATNYPAISSMEVELSASEAEGGEAMPNSPYKQVEPKTPQRASEVFSFLTARRKSLREQVARSRSPSLTPSPVTPANTGPNTNTNSSPQSVAPFSLESPTSTPTSFSDTQSQYSQAQIKTATLAKLSAAPAVYSPFSVPSQSLARETSISPHKLVSQSPIENLRRPSTGSYVETPLPSSSKLPINRIPRGPRPRPTSTSSNLDPFRTDLPLENTQHVPAASRWQNLRDALDDPRGKAREALTSIPVRRHRRTTSRATSSSSHSPAVNLDSDKDDTDDDTSKVSGPSKIARFRRPETNTKDNRARSSSRPGHAVALNSDKENTNDDVFNTPVPSRLPRLRKPEDGATGNKNQTKLPPTPISAEMQDPVLIPPSTPLRSTTPLRPRSIFDVRHPHLVRDAPSSPASSSELSPITQDIMTDLRKQRSRARSFWRRGRDSPGTER